MKKRYIVAAALLIAVPAIAIAKEDGERGHHRKHGAPFERLDTDKDGKVTAEEAKAGSAKMFERADRNGDGVITADEAPRLFERIDADGDGKITADELAANAASRIMRADANGDGVVTKEEADAARDKMKAMRGERGKGDQPPPPPEDAPPPPAGTP